MNRIRSWISGVAVLAVLGLFAEQVRAVLLWNPGNPLQNGATYGSEQGDGTTELDGKYKVDGAGKLTVTVRGFCRNFTCTAPRLPGTIVKGTLTAEGTETVDGEERTWTRGHTGEATTCPGSSAEYEAFVFPPAGGTITSVKVTIKTECTCCLGVNPVPGAYPDHQWDDRPVTPS